MAATSKPTAATAAVLLALLVAAAVIVSLAEASTLTVFTGPGGCAGMPKDINGCGCFDISGHQGGFHFVFTEGQKAALYTGYKCDGSVTPLTMETRRCVENNYKSVKMIC